ncbi:PadR family transcriptional regulator [Microbulbifer bruguierae]|uniref:PadR family transcriptional regulator n=1 Tax=Microbulbifer bruguierae TaxID=3029061 RepID=A0ABY8NB75_9GAMM|nr:PadR family transcriptional regulator [Microbulbifer bruguierae]WGL15695.1 PadR family transcriptional regulator [Microbulbifer bruguierae]
MSLRFAVLTLLDIEPGSGYDLKRRFERSVNHFWSASHQQMYRELHKLHQEGLLDCEEQIQDGRPDKKVYSLTEAGRATLRQLAARPAAAQKIRDPFLLQLFAGHHLPPALMRAQLERQLAEHRQELATYEAQNARFYKRPPEQQQMLWLSHQPLLLGIETEKAWIQWAERLLQRLQQEESGAQN